MTKTHSKRFNAQRAARSALGNKDAKEGVDFETRKTPENVWEFIILSESEQDQALADMEANRKAALADVPPQEPRATNEATGSEGQPIDPETGADIEPEATDEMSVRMRERAQAKREKREAREAKKASAAAPKASKARSGSKRAIVESLLLRKGGATAKEILAATGWKALNIPGTARSLGLNVRQEKEGRTTTYYGSR